MYEPRMLNSQPLWADCLQTEEGNVKPNRIPGPPLLGRVFVSSKRRIGDDSVGVAREDCPTTRRRCARPCAPRPTRTLPGASARVLASGDGNSFVCEIAPAAPSGRFQAAYCRVT